MDKKEIRCGVLLSITCEKQCEKLFKNIALFRSSKNQ